jgi:hypothetical protein
VRTSRLVEVGEPFFAPGSPPRSDMIAPLRFPWTEVLCTNSTSVSNKERQRATRARRARKPPENGLIAASSSKSSSVSLATLAAIRRASSLLSSLAAEGRPGSSSK